MALLKEQLAIKRRPLKEGEECGPLPSQVTAAHFEDAFSRIFPSVSKADQRLYISSSIAMLFILLGYPLL